MPSGPSDTACTAAVFVTIVKTMSLRSATSRGLSAQRAPAASSGSAFSRRPVPDGDGVAGVEQPAGDAAAHHSEADVAELSHAAPFDAAA